MYKSISFSFFFHIKIMIIYLTCLLNFKHFNRILTKKENLTKKTFFSLSLKTRRKKQKKRWKISKRECKSDFCVMFVLKKYFFSLFPIEFPFKFE